VKSHVTKQLLERALNTVLMPIMGVKQSTSSNIIRANDASHQVEFVSLVGGCLRSGVCTRRGNKSRHLVSVIHRCLLAELLLCSLHYVFANC